jgi:hypothetical protein
MERLFGDLQGRSNVISADVARCRISGTKFEATGVDHMNVASWRERPGSTNERFSTGVLLVQYIVRSTPYKYFNLRNNQPRIDSRCRCT